MTGGFTGEENTKSTEIFTAGATAWTSVGGLPTARNGMRATTLNNMIYLLGISLVSGAFNTLSIYF